MNQVFIIIATALQRSNLLFERSLLSVYKQVNINPEQIKIFIIDDNELDESGFPITMKSIQNGVLDLRKHLNLTTTAFETFVMPNSRTKNNSGTGAWNTGIYLAYNMNPDAYIAILDDDDEYLPTHIADCIHIALTDSNIHAVFQELIWQNQDASIWNFPLSMGDMNDDTFYIGNPGIQGSNMFFKIATLIKINGFDESLSGSTDRDLLIRFFSYLAKHHIDVNTAVKIIHSIGIIHHNHSAERVTKSSDSKQKSLDKFYEKHRENYTEDAYQASIARAVKLFNYKVNCNA